MQPDLTIGAHQSHEVLVMFAVLGGVPLGESPDELCEPKVMPPGAHDVDLESTPKRRLAEAGIPFTVFATVLASDEETYERRMGLLGSRWLRHRVLARMLVASGARTRVIVPVCSAC